MGLCRSGFNSGLTLPFRNLNTWTNRFGRVRMNGALPLLTRYIFNSLGANGQNLYVDELNWWPLTFSLKCARSSRVTPPSWPQAKPDLKPAPVGNPMSPFLRDSNLTTGLPRRGRPVGSSSCKGRTRQSGVEDRTYGLGILRCCPGLGPASTLSTRWDSAADSEV